MNLRVKRLTGAVLEIPAVVTQASRRYNANVLGVLRKLLVSIKHRYLPVEALGEGLLNPALPDTEFQTHISRSSLVTLQERRNPLSWDALLSDKTIFYRFCLAAEIPVPALYALFSRHSPGWSCSGKLIIGRNQWVSFLKDECPPDFVIKPDRGAHGEGIHFFHRDGSHFLDQEGNRIDPGQIVDMLMSDRRYEMFVIQERLRNHEDIMNFMGTDALVSLRVVSVLQPDGTCLLPYVHFKIIGGDRYFDNYGHGEHGNLMVGVDSATGILQEVLISDGKSILLHPKTGQRIAGFRIPLWKETCAAVAETARLFAPVGTVGWDVAVTTRGPVILEGNMWYDQPSPPDIRPFLSILRLPGESSAS